MADQFDYGRSADTALRLIQKFGKTITLSRSTPGSGPEHNPGPATWEDTGMVAVVLPANKGPKGAFDNEYEEGSSIEGMYRYVLGAAKGLAFEPLEGMALKFQGHEWTILGSTPLCPADIPVLYQIGCKRS